MTTESAPADQRRDNVTQLRQLVSELTAPRRPQPLQQAQLSLLDTILKQHEAAVADLRHALLEGSEPC